MVSPQNGDTRDGPPAPLSNATAKSFAFMCIAYVQQLNNVISSFYKQRSTFLNQEYFLAKTCKQAYLLRSEPGRNRKA